MDNAQKRNVKNENNQCVEVFGLEANFLKILLLLFYKDGKGILCYKRLRLKWQTQNQH